MNAIRVLVVDDDPAHAELLSTCLDRCGDPKAPFDVAVARHADEARQVLSHDSVDLVFVDYQLGAVSGLELVKLMRRSGDRRPVIVTTAHGDEYLAVEMIQAGADDYLSKFDLSPERVKRAIERVMGRRQAATDADTARDDAARRLLTLTPRERDVLELIVSGLMNREIADRLCRSEKTIKIHRANIMQKMDATTAADLVRLVMTAQRGTKADDWAGDGADRNGD